MGITVCRHQRANAQAQLDAAIATANGPPSWERTCYRQWLQTPSEARRVLLAQAGYSEGQWATRIAPLVRYWTSLP